VVQEEGEDPGFGSGCECGKSVYVSRAVRIKMLMTGSDDEQRRY
jgi:hypothetical protein